MASHGVLCPVNRCCLGLNMVSDRAFVFFTTIFGFIFIGDLMGFNGDLMGFNGDLMGFNGD